ncbi:DNA photolyase, FAD-binding/Cryptochrome [Tribonema minus]|uniref:Cryptochrome DASH n=1 Tax=Tribonema minus TaxID=303371 RepID=A0A835ZER2_9STRA|nr:DNA photolyase, FAD-binding/Cryptochrome [Tribonema minus]
MASTKVVVFFRNDLRVADNYCLNLASKEAAKAKERGDTVEVLPVYCFDPRNFGETEFGSPKTGAYRTRFLLECVADLRHSLQSLGSDLCVSTEAPEALIPRLLQSDGDKRRHIVTCQTEVTSEEMAADEAVERSARGAGGGAEFSMQRVWGATLYHPEDMVHSIEQLPEVFTKWRTQTEAKNVPIRAPQPAPAKGALPLPAKDANAAFWQGCSAPLPTLQDLGFAEGETGEGDPKGVLPFRGGEIAAMARLNHYTLESDALATYFDTRNGMLGADYSSKFSPWLAAGCVSARAVHAACKRYEAERVANKSTYWMTFELMWRDYFKFYVAKHGARLFYPDGVHPREGHKWQKDFSALAAWKEGRTGSPLVDANMREIAATGFMSNRGRQNAASYLVHDLGLDWRLGADHFESLLLDYDVASNWGNWHALAGLQGGRLNRFNIPKQAHQYDPDGAYVRHWCPELARVPRQHVHAPHAMPRALQAEVGCRVGPGGDYPAPQRTLPFSASEVGQRHGDLGGGKRRGGRGGRRRG